MRLRTIALIVALTLGILALPLATKAQQKKVPTLGYLATGCCTGSTAETFHRRMRELGSVPFENLRVLYKLYGEHPELLPELAGDLVRLKVDVILAVGPDAVGAAKKATDTIPIVMLYSVDPVRFGFAKSLARPGGNVTGFVWDTGVDDFSAKSLEVYKETLPHARTLAVLWNLENLSHRPYLEAMQVVAPRLGVRVVSIGIRSREDLSEAFRRMKAERADALVVYADPLTVPLRDPIMGLATAQKLPTFVGADFGFKNILGVFGPHVADMPARAAGFVDRILKGTKPADLPIEQPMKYDLMINLKVAKELGLTIPRSILIRADRVIQ